MYFLHYSCSPLSKKNKKCIRTLPPKKNLGVEATSVCKKKSKGFYILLFFFYFLIKCTFVLNRHAPIKKKCLSSSPSRVKKKKYRILEFELRARMQKYVGFLSNQLENFFIFYFYLRGKKCIGKMEKGWERLGNYWEKKWKNDFKKNEEKFLFKEKNDKKK
ncbi:hypothetical protein RFI_05992 [Reticulomyxa filosa]|uniref:Uncharacterized protein n=1 Tax=Reticulomyxa filosa TaxID=46433 RepID=X6NZ67_RETFI|nr:hypothetical protein RFI_05992 [Reticulomyxa filosa]|eukprot:ETO31134.1 hypothetical protein RFI_05992 [Reticulomyxa filosa]